MTPIQRDEVEKTLDRYMGEHGLKSTKQRSLIVDVFFEMHGHFSVEEVWGRVRQDNPRVSVATVYRTMKLLGCASIKELDGSFISCDRW
jgi:Fur family ferric uptake transcriptional regulator